MDILIRLTTDNNLIFRKGAVGHCKVILRTNFRWWCPKIGMELCVENYLKLKTWTFLRDIV